MRLPRIVHRIGFFQYAGPVVAIVLLAISMMGCQDTRITVREFIEMQKQIDAEMESTTPTSPRCIQAVRRNTADRNAAPAAAATAPSAQPPAPVAIDAPTVHEEVADEGMSAVRSSSVVQVSHTETPEKTKPSWFFDAKRGEWVQVTMPKKPRVRRTSTHKTQFPAEAYAQLAPSDTDATARHDAAIGDAQVPVQSNTPIPGGVTQPIQELVQLARSPYRLGPEDLLTITLTGLTGIDTIAEPAAIEVRVAHDGTISLPLIGSIHVGDHDIVTAERMIHDAYVPKFVPTLSVGIRVQAYKTADVVVVGAAELPGIVQLPRNQRTALHAVAAAGGMTQLASGEVIIQRIRDPENKISVYLRNSSDLQAVLAMDPLSSGDVIEVVAAQPNTIFVGGLVNLPGPREFPPGTEVTALQALAAAGGVVEPVFPKEATLIRRMPNGKDVHVRIDLEKTRSGEDPNVTLAPGDIFWVPETWGTRTMAFINQSFFIRAGATVSYNVTGIEFLNRPRQQVGQVGNNVRNSVDPLGFLVP